jgi:hypothetical protein
MPGFCTAERCEDIYRRYRSLRSLNPRLFSLHASGVQCLISRFGLHSP